MRRCEDVKMRRWEDVKMRRCEDVKMSRWEDLRMRRCEDEKIRRGEDVRMRRCEDEKMWRWEDVKMRRCFTDPHYWKNPALRRSREKLHAVVARSTFARREAHLQVKMYKTPGSRSTFGTWDVKKVRAVVTRSTFPSQNVQNTPFSDHFWKLRCRKSVRRCGGKHISKWKCTKHTRSGPLLAVEMSKKCTPLWREAHVEVKMYKTPQLRTTFGSWDVESVHCCRAKHISKSKC